MAVPTNAIKEANEQILLMHSKMQEMEQEIKVLNEKLAAKDAEESKIQMQQVLNKKDTEIQGLRSGLRAANERINVLEQELLDNEVQMEKLQSKSKILEEIIGFRGSLEGLLSYFKIVQEMDVNRNDVNGNLRETEITDGYQSDDVTKTSLVVNGRPDDTGTTELVDHV
jgi:predicted RNase H-like nuclease (RuvC/YqgF family)